jgi:hypothetical protein
MHPAVALSSGIGGGLTTSGVEGLSALRRAHPVGHRVAARASAAVSFPLWPPLHRQNPAWPP